MRKNILLASSLAVALSAPAFAQTEPAKVDPVKTMVGRLELAKYKATIKGLTQFGDREKGTDRNRAAVDWIEAQLNSYGCSNIERIKYVVAPAPVAQQPPAQTGARTPPALAIVSGEIRSVLCGRRL